MATNFKALAKENEDLKREIAGLKASSSNCSMCRLRKDPTLNVSMNPTGKSAELYSQELKLKCLELEADLKTHKLVINKLTDLVREA